MNRREFVAGSAGTLAAALLQPARAGTGAVRVGGPIFVEDEDPEVLAKAHRALGYRAAYCPALEVRDTDRVRATRDAFARHDVVIAEVGRWCNLLDADDEKRRKNLDEVINGLALAEAVGARCCVDIAGSFHPTIWFGPHPDNLSSRFFDAAVENARRIIDAVKPQRAHFCYEMMGWSLPDSVDSQLRLLRAVDRERFGVHLDPCNLINSPSRFYANTDLLNDCFDRLGASIVSCHAKDLAWQVEYNVHFKEVRPGLGSLDYATYLKRLASLPGETPLMLEHLDGAGEYDRARDHVFDECRKAGVRF
jgi:sugar phosphate isomerase/epimerase